MSTEENSTPKELSLGQLFKQTREEKDLHVENISRETRISRSILQSLEEDRIEELPKKIYVAGFVKTYARLLELDEEICLRKLEQLYNQDFEVAQDDSEQSVVLQSQKEPPSYSSKALFIIPVIIISIVLILFVRSNKKDEAQNSTNQQTSEESSSTLSTELTVKEVLEKKIEPKPTTTPEVAKEATKPVPKTVKKPEVKPEVKEKKKEEKKEAKKEEKKEIKFSPMPSPLYSIDKNASDETLSKLPERVREQYNKGVQNVYLYADGGDSWLTYQKNQGEIFKYVLKNGKDLFLQSEQIKMFIGNVHVTKIFLNNEPLKVPSRSGVKSIVFPQSAAKDLMIPLFIFNSKDGSVQSSEDYLEQKAVQEADL